MYNGCIYCQEHRYERIIIYIRSGDKTSSTDIRFGVQYVGISVYEINQPDYGR